MLWFGLTMLAFGQLPPPDDAIAMIERTGCNAACPAYRILVFGDGRVLWEGKENVKVIGKAQLKLKPGDLKAVHEAFATAHFLELTEGRDCYDRASGPPVFLFYRAEGKSKLLNDYRACQSAKVIADLSALEKKLDLLLQSARWVGRP